MVDIGHHRCVQLHYIVSYHIYIEYQMMKHKPAVGLSWLRRSHELGTGFKSLCPTTASFPEALFLQHQVFSPARKPLVTSWEARPCGIWLCTYCMQGRLNGGSHGSQCVKKKFQDALSWSGSLQLLESMKQCSLAKRRVVLTHFFFLFSRRLFGFYRGDKTPHVLSFASWLTLGGLKHILKASGN